MKKQITAKTLDECIYWLVGYDLENDGMHDKHARRIFIHAATLTDLIERKIDGTIDTTNMSPEHPVFIVEIDAPHYIAYGSIAVGEYTMERAFVKATAWLNEALQETEDNWIAKILEK